MSEITNLGDDLIETINSPTTISLNSFRKSASSKRSGSSLSESLDRDKWIPNLMGHARGQIRQKAARSTRSLFLAQFLLSGNVLHDRDRAERCVIDQASAVFPPTTSGAVLVNPQTRGQLPVVSSASRKNAASVPPAASTGFVQNVGTG